ncbi:hypothetical protein GPL20_32355 [Bradyrhizobium cajani]|uniref:Uncharacterized protein n=1 Tax=Bradyrhizobium cajani TaxID=1928661 RepID=A0A844TPF0_9BRAD|nr:hypothetical protein [Bradyrhizobium cajani]
MAGEGESPRVDLVDIRRTLSTSSLRAQRSNPESLREKILDCFAALAMTRRRGCGFVFHRFRGESPSPQPSPRKNGARERTVAVASARIVFLHLRVASEEQIRAWRVIRASSRTPTLIFQIVK